MFAYMCMDEGWLNNLTKACAGAVRIVCRDSVIMMQSTNALRYERKLAKSRITNNPGCGLLT